MLTQKRAKDGIEAYFASRRIPKKDKSGAPLTDPAGAPLYEEKPYTVSGLVLALGLSRREDLDRVTDKKVRALIDRALLRIEESAEEKLFQKDLFQGTKLFLTTNFPRWQGAEPAAEESGDGLGLFALWGN